MIMFLEQSASHLCLIHWGLANLALCHHIISHNYRQTYSCMLWQSFSQPFKTFFIRTLFVDQSKLGASTETLHLHDVLNLRSKMVSRVGSGVSVMLTWFIFSCPHNLSLPSIQNNHPVLEYRDKLFTHSNQKPASKERIQHQGIVKLSLSPASSNAPTLTHSLSLFILLTYTSAQ